MINRIDPQTLPTAVIIELTRRCNNNCLYCYTAWGEPKTGYEKSSVEMSTDEIKELIVKLQKEIPLKTIGLSGGEPLLREDLPEILSFISSRGLDASVITNGAFLDYEQIIKTKNEKTIYQVTLLSYRKEIHDKLAGRRGAWDAAVNGMLTLRRAKANMVSVFVATKLNYADLRSTAELALALGAKALMYNRMNLGAHNIKFAEELLPTPEIIIENLNTLEDLGEKYGLTSAASVVIEPCVVQLGNYKHVQLGWCPLAGPDSYFTIDPSGNIRVCNHSPVILGNVKRESFREVYLNHSYVKSFREVLPKECEACTNKMRSLCLGGCKAAGEQCNGTIEKVDPFVTINKGRRYA